MILYAWPRFWPERSRGQEFDLVLTGCMANDDGQMAVGVALAEELGVAHAAMVKKVEVWTESKSEQRA